MDLYVFLKQNELSEFSLRELRVAACHVDGPRRKSRSVTRMAGRNLLASSRASLVTLHPPTRGRITSRRPLVGLFLCARLPGVTHCTRKSCVFFQQGQIDTNCTTNRIMQHSRKAVFHRFCLWNRFFCRSEEQIIPCTVLLRGDYIPSAWVYFAVTLDRTDVFCRPFGSRVCTATPCFFRHAGKELSRIVAE